MWYWILHLFLSNRTIFKKNKCINQDDRILIVRQDLFKNYIIADYGFS